MASELHPAKSFIDFIAHVLVGAIAFLILFLVSAAIGEVVRWLEAGGYLSEIVVITMRFFEYAIFFADLMLLAVLVIAESLNFIRNMLRSLSA